ncbi:hypothetical protein Ae406Ps2_6490 [Pseudonocardia sp. Ae406_Ps2]|nr:hypothetical protein Ae406Ps2_6490 [Pseudonocardia sp. Ae406_Ps2]
MTRAVIGIPPGPERGAGEVVDDVGGAPSEHRLGRVLSAATRPAPRDVCGVLRGQPLR